MPNNKEKRDRFVWGIKKRKPAFNGKDNPNALNILIIHKTDYRNHLYREKLFKQYPFLNNKRLYNVTVKNIRKKPPILDYVKIYIDDNVPDAKVFSIKRMFPKAIVLRYSLDDSKKKKATVDIKVTKLETKKFFVC